MLPTFPTPFREEAIAIRTLVIISLGKILNEMGVLFTVKVGEGDAGMVIGKGGRTIQAIRIVMTTVGIRKHARVNIQLDVPEKKPEEQGLDF